MTIIAYRDGIIAADSCVTWETEAGGSRNFGCDKLFRKTITEGTRQIPVIVGCTGESFASMVFMDWYGTNKDKPQELFDLGADFCCLILRPDGLYEVDAYCRPVQVKLPRSSKRRFHAQGSGSSIALGAMCWGATAAQACRTACEYTPYCKPPIISMRLG